jgi:riboflavin synthase alpha subunit
MAMAASLLRVRVSWIQDGTKLGDSIAVDGIDLTVAEIKGTELSLNVMAEAYRVTTLGRLGDEVPGQPGASDAGGGPL